MSWEIVQDVLETAKENRPLAKVLITALFFASCAPLHETVARISRYTKSFKSKPSEIKCSEAISPTS